MADVKFCDNCGDRINLNADIPAFYNTPTKTFNRSIKLTFCETCLNKFETNKNNLESEKEVEKCLN